MWHCRHTVDLFSQPSSHGHATLHTGIRGLADEEVVTLDDVSLQTEILGGLLEEGQDLLVAEVLSVLVGATRNLSHLQEVLPHRLGFGELVIEFVEITTQ